MGAAAGAHFPRPEKTSGGAIATLTGPSCKDDYGVVEKVDVLALRRAWQLGDLGGADEGMSFQYYSGRERDCHVRAEEMPGFLERGTLVSK